MGVRISGLTETTSAADTDTAPLDTSSGTRKITWANIKTAIFGAINGLTSKSTPVGADVIVIGDSGSSFAGKKATLNSLAGAITQYAKLSDTKAANTSGGTFTSGAWQTRTLNTEDHDDSGIVALSSNQFTLQAGTYEILATAPAFAVTMHKAKLRNVSDSTDIIIGTSEYSNAGLPQTRSKICGRFTIAAAKIFEIQHRCASTIATQGFGVESNFSVPEVYTVVEIWKVA
jgi:hypothetical protein